MPAVLRILVLIPLGYIAACFAAGLVFALSLSTLRDAPDAAAYGILVAFGISVAAYAGAFAAIPMLIAITLAEAFRWRSFFFWSLFGGVLGVAGKALADIAWGNLPTPGVVVLYAAAGIAAGAAYWLIAGRRSGLPEKHPA